MPEENNFPNSPEITPSDQFSDSTESELAEPDQANQSPKYSVFFIALAALLMMLGLGYYLGTRSSQPVTQPTTEAAPTSPAANGQTTPLADLTGQAPEAPVAQPKSIAFIKNFQLFIKEGSGNKLISKEGEAVKDFVQPPDGKYIAYSYGISENKVGSDGQPWVSLVPNKVVLHNINTQNSKEIFSIPPFNSDQIDWEHKVSYVVFSQDSSLAAIGSSHGIHIYNVVTGSLEELVRNPYLGNIPSSMGGGGTLPGGKSFISGYQPGGFSRNNEKLLAFESHWEWREPFIVDLVSKEVSFKEELKVFNQRTDSVYWFINDNEILGKRSSSPESISQELLKIGIYPEFKITSTMEHPTSMEIAKIINPGNSAFLRTYDDIKNEKNEIIGSKINFGKVSNITTTPKIEQIYILEEFKNFPSDGQIGYIYDVWDENTLTAALHQAGVTHLVKVDLASKTIEILEQNIDQPNY